MGRREEHARDLAQDGSLLHERRHSCSGSELTGWLPTGLNESWERARISAVLRDENVVGYVTPAEQERICQLAALVNGNASEVIHGNPEKKADQVLRFWLECGCHPGAWEKIPDSEDWERFKVSAFYMAKGESCFAQRIMAAGQCEAIWTQNVSILANDIGAFDRGRSPSLQRAPACDRVGLTSLVDLRNVPLRSQYRPPPFGVTNTRR